MRLSGWKRIGIVVSVVWMLVGSIWFWSQMTEQAASFATIAVKACQLKNGFSSSNRAEDCLQVYNKSYDQMLDPAAKALTPIGAGAVYAFVVLVVAWLALWIVLVVVRWVRAGFVHQPQAAETISPSADDGPRKRAEPRL
jgi:hypothetical protein